MIIKGQNLNSSIFEIGAVIFLCSLLAVFAFNSAIFDRNMLVGEWEAEDLSRKTSFVLEQDGSCTFVNQNKSTFENILFKGVCNLDFSKSPFTIRLISSQNESKIYYTIFKIVNSRTVSIANFTQQWKLRPISFNETSYELKRKENYHE